MARRAPSTPQEPQGQGSLRCVWESCTLREDVRKGELPEESFAARLSDVVQGKAVAVYQDPKVFFERTHVTASMEELLRTVHSRLFDAKSTANPIVRLETSFGGGKTHSLIALYHATKSRGNIPALSSILTPAKGKGEVRIAAVVGTDVDPTPRKPDALAKAPRTLWGEIARQLGAYEALAENDQLGTAPSAKILEPVLTGAPTLILIDEIARYLRVAREVTLARGTLDQQIPAFLHALFELAGASPHLVIVLTLAGRDDAYGDETDDIHSRLAEMQSVLARKERILTPVGENDLASVICRRLFERVDRSPAEGVAAAFQSYYQELYDKGAPIPSDAARTDYRHAIVGTYPFHPALLNVLDKKVSTIDTFNRTRGALRLLGQVLRRLFEVKPADAWLVQPGHVDLGAQAIAHDLSARLKRSAEPIAADVVSAREGDPAHAQALDRAHVAEGRPPIAARVAQTVWLHSLSSGNAGCDRAELNLAVLTPGLDPHHVEKAADDLLDQGWYLYQEGHRLRFKDDPSLTKIISDEVRHVPTTDAKQLIETWVRKIYGSGAFALADFPDGPEDVPDGLSQPRLAVLHMDSAEADVATKTMPEILKRIVDKRSAQGDLRLFPNLVVCLVANTPDKDLVLQTAKKVKALAAIKKDRERVKGLTREQQDELKGRAETAELDLRMAITSCWRHLYYPSAEGDGGLARLTLPSQDRSTAQQDQQRVLVEALRGAKKLLTGDDRPLAAAYIKDKVWPGLQEELCLDKFAEAWGRKRDLPIVLDPALLKAIVAEGARTGVWGYHDGSTLWFKAKDWPHTDPVAGKVELSDQHRLVEAARAKGLAKPKKTEKREEPEPDDLFAGTKKTAQKEKKGPSVGAPPVVTRDALPARAFEEAMAEAGRYPDARIHRIRMRAEGADDARRIGLAVARWTDLTVMVEAEVEAVFPAGADGGAEDRATLRFEGTWARFRAQLKPAAESLASAAQKAQAELTVSTRLTLVPKGPLSPDDATLASVAKDLTELEVGKLGLELVTAAGA